MPSRTAARSSAHHRQVRDTTESKRAEEARAAGRRQLQAIIDNTPAIVYAFDLQERFVMANITLATLFETTPEQMIGKRRHAFMPQEDADRHEANDRTVIEAGRALEFEECSNLEGDAITWLTTKFPLRDAGGRIYAVAGISTNLTERKRAERALRDSEERERLRAAELQTLLDMAPIGIAIATDASGHHIEGNRANEEMFGLPPRAELSKAGPAAAGFRAFQDGRELATLELPMQRAVRGETVREQVFDVVRDDGQELAVYAKAAPLFDRAGRPRGAVGAFLDITALKRAEEALVEANAALAIADRRKDEFIAVLSHELRNPLAPIRFALPLLAEERLGPAGRRAIEVIDRQVSHLARLVDDLLDVSRITAGKIELRRERVALGGLVTAAVDAASPAIASGTHSLEISVPDGPVWLDVDAARISQAITNLLNNSAKYTPQGGRIRLEATADEAGAIIRVIDNGIGLAPEALTSVFEMFRQASDPNRAQGGLGIGLTLARQLVEMHGGSIEAHSEGQGQGAEFVIRLPLATAAGPGDEQPAATPCGQPACLRVLVVDDNADLVEMLGMVVEAAGHQVRKALDGRSALSAAVEYRPHVILLDIGMPGMSGVDVAQQLRQHSETSSAHIVALTGWGQVKDRNETAEAGFDEHLTKPADPQQIQRILAEVAQELAANGGSELAGR